MKKYLKQCKNKKILFFLCLFLCLFIVNIWFLIFLINKNSLSVEQYTSTNNTNLNYLKSTTKKQNTQLDDFTIGVILQDHFGNIFISNNKIEKNLQEKNGLWEKKINSKAFIQINALKGLWITVIYQNYFQRTDSDDDYSENIWVGTKYSEFGIWTGTLTNLRAGIFVWENHTEFRGSSIQFLADPRTHLIYLIFYTVYKDYQLWKQEKNGSWTKQFQNGNEKREQISPIKLYFDLNDNLWVGTHFNGLWVKKVNNNEDDYKHVKWLPKSVLINNIVSFKANNKLDILFSTQSDGLFICTDNLLTNITCFHIFSNYKITALNINYSGLLIGTVKHGLWEINISDFDLTIKKIYAGKISINKIIRNKKNIFFSTDKNIYKKENNSTKFYALLPKNSQLKIKCFYLLSDGYMWIVTDKNGITVVNTNMTKTDYRAVLITIIIILIFGGLILLFVLFKFRNQKILKSTKNKRFQKWKIKRAEKVKLVNNKHLKNKKDNYLQ